MRSGSTPYYNAALAASMWIGRYGVIIPVLARRAPSPVSAMYPPARARSAWAPVLEHLHLGAGGLYR